MPGIRRVRPPGTAVSIESIQDGSIYETDDKYLLEPSLKLTYYLKTRRSLNVKITYEVSISMATTKGISRAELAACMAMCSVALIALTFAGCVGRTQVAATEQMQGIERIDGATIEEVKNEKQLEGIGAYDNILIEPFAASDEFKQDYKIQLSMFNATMLNDLRTKKKFKKVLDGNTPIPEGKTVRVTGRIIDMSIKSLFYRVLWGMAARSSYMDVYIKLTDEMTQKTIKEKVISTYNNRFGAYYGAAGSDQSMPADMGQIIAAYLIAVIPKT